MRAEVGDRLLISRRRPSERDRVCRVKRLCGRGSTAPFLVEWYDTGTEELLLPDLDTAILNSAGSLL